MVTDGISILQSVLGVHGLGIPANCFMLFLQRESWSQSWCEGRKLPSSDLHIMDLDRNNVL